MSVKKFVIMLEAWCRTHGHQSNTVSVCSFSTSWRGGRLVHDVLLNIGNRQEMVTFEDDEI